jgi:hypothetical protein
MFVTSQGSTYSRFQRAVPTGNLTLIEAAAPPSSRIRARRHALILLAQGGLGEQVIERC